MKNSRGEDSVTGYDGDNYNSYGMTIREHFAGLAMQGLITLKGSDCQDSEITAKQCVRMADALLEALDNDKGES